MYVLNRIDGTTEPTLRAKLLGIYETLDEARKAMLKDVDAETRRLMMLEYIEGIDFERKLYHMGAHLFHNERFWQWVIFDADRPAEWNSLLSW